MAAWSSKHRLHARSARRSGLRRRTVERHLNCRSTPQARHPATLTQVAFKLAGEQLEGEDDRLARDPIALFAAFVRRSMGEVDTTNL